MECVQIEQRPICTPRPLAHFSCSSSVHLATSMHSPPSLRPQKLHDLGHVACDRVHLALHALHLALHALHLALHAPDLGPQLGPQPTARSDGSAPCCKCRSLRATCPVAASAIAIRLSPVTPPGGAPSSPPPLSPLLQFLSLAPAGRPGHPSLGHQLDWGWGPGGARAAKGGVW